jgi:predicted GNAT family acetyltransferase
VVVDNNHRLALENFDRDVLSDARPIYAVLVDGEIASTCVSAREDSDSAEAWVQTASPFRRRGLARQVTAAWGHHALRAGKTAFYSHAATNAASRGLAASLDLAWLLDAVGYL